MAWKKPIYRIWFWKPTQAWWRLSEEERNENARKLDEKLEEVGGKNILTCTPYWSNEEWAMMGVEEFPNIEAAQEFSVFLWETSARYGQAKTYLCTNLPP